MILVTGGAGFIGSHLANRFHSEGRSVTVVDDLSGGWADNLHPDIPLVEANLVDVDLDVLFEGVTEVWHLAAYAAEGLSHWVREHNVRNNWLASTRLIQAAVKHSVEHFYFTSSMAVYGTQPVPYTEDMVPRPEDPYGVAKYAVELDLRAAHRLFGLPYTVFRPHNVYGPNQNVGDPYRNVVGIFMRQALNGGPLTVFGDGLQTRAFSYITDIVNPMVAARHADTNGRTFNIGGEQPVAILELASHVSRLFGGVPIVHAPERFEVKHAYCDHAEARERLGFNPQTDFGQGLKIMAEWVEQVGIRMSVPPPLEMTRNLPEFWR
jgi:UDP-glucose 4-epimerase